MLLVVGVRMEEEKMCDRKTIKDIDEGKKKVVGKWEYLFNYWSPLIALIGFLVAGIFWFANAEGRMFDSVDMKIRAEQHLEDTKNLDDIYIRKDQYNEQMKTMNDDLKEIQRDIKELLKRK